MQATIPVDNKMLEQLLQLAGTQNKTEAVNLAIASFIRHKRVQRFKKLRGTVDVVSNDELEAAELARGERLTQRQE